MPYRLKRIQGHKPEQVKPLDIVDKTQECCYSWIMTKLQILLRHDEKRPRLWETYVCNDVLRCYSDIH